MVEVLAAKPEFRRNYKGETINMSAIFTELKLSPAFRAAVEQTEFKRWLTVSDDKTYLSFYHFVMQRIGDVSRFLKVEPKPLAGITNFFRPVGQTDPAPKRQRISAGDKEN